MKNLVIPNAEAGASEVAVQNNLLSYYNLLNMKILSSILIAIILFSSTTVFAQKKDSNKNKKKKTEISIEERNQSATFADGLREYYANDYTNAEKTLRNVINANSKNDAAYFMLGKVCYDAQKYTINNTFSQ